jgi:glycosyltransferase involved in cell wall biosynthesis
MTSRNIKEKCVKVCHLTSVHSYQDPRIFIKECRTLSCAHYITSLIAPDAPDSIIDGVCLISVKKHNNNRLLRMTYTVWQIYRKALAIDADIYHFHDPELLIIGLLLKLKKKKVVYDVHEDVPKQILSKNYIPVFIRSSLSAFIQTFENIAVQFFDGIITATPFIRDRFAKLGCRAIDIKNYPISSELCLNEATSRENGNYICYIGTINGARGLFQMVEAISQTKTQLLLGGRFDFLEERERAIKMPGWQKVIELGMLDRQGVAQTLSKSIAGLVVLHPLVNYKDALPVKMFEYMAAGIPVISSNIPYWQEIVESSQSGICVDPMEPDSIAEAIEWIVNHPTEAQLMGKYGRKAVEEKYNWEHEGKALLSFYQKILQEN